MIPVRILLADDHTVMRNGLRLLLERQPHLQVVGEAADGRQAVALSETPIRMWSSWTSPCPT
jgi:DNA-binding NarL/FixJ family response regulator